MISVFGYCSGGRLDCRNYQFQRTAAAGLSACSFTDYVFQVKQDQ